MRQPGSDRGKTAAELDAEPIFKVPALSLAGLVSSLFINILGLALPLSILQIYDRILPNSAMATLFFLGAGLCTVVIAEAGLRIMRFYLIGLAASEAGYAATIAAVNKVLRAPPSAIERSEPTVHMERFDALAGLADYHGSQSRLLLIDAPFAILFLGMIVVIGGYLVMVPVIVCMFFGILTLLIGRRLKAALEAAAVQDRRRHDFIIDVLSGIQTIKLMTMEPFMQRRFERLQEASANVVRRVVSLGTDAQTTGNLFANIMMVATVSVGAVMVIEGQLTVGALASCTLLSGRAIQPLLKAFGLWVELQGVSLHASRVREISELDVVPEGEVLDTFVARGCVEMDQVVFAYPGQEKPVFDGLSLQCRAGEMIGISGSDGAGKTTFVRLLQGELSAQSGSVLIHGHDISGPHRRSLLHSVAYAPQRGVIFSGTILENIAMFQSGYALERARWAARLIGLEADIHRLPDGYDTQLGQSIIDAAPDGFIQRIAIARALSRKPSILIFDEANAVLDQRADNLLRDGLAELKGSMTIILISNRPSFLRLADYVFDLSQSGLRPVSGTPAFDRLSHQVTVPASHSTSVA